MLSSQPSQDPFADAEADWNLPQLYSDLAKAKQNFASHRRPGLTSIEKQHLCGLLCGYSPAEIAEKMCKASKSVEVDLCNTIYRYVEALTERSTNSLDNWRTVAVWLRAKGYYRSMVQVDEQPASNPQLKLLHRSEAPDVSVFWGRESELTMLKQWVLTDRCRLIALLGIGGIGKTMLAAQLVDQIKGEFDCLIWRSLLHPVPLETLLADWLNHLSQYLQVDIPDQIDGQISCLIQALHLSRCLLVLDGLETILQSGDFAGHYHSEYRGYGELLNRIGQTRHQSCILLTSREKPPEVAVLEGEAFQVRSVGLNGLTSEAAQEILRAKGLSQPDHWHKLITFFRGNPLTLKLVATSIQDLFGGDVSTFLQESPTYVTRDLSVYLRELLNRLSSIQWQIMYALADAQEPLTLAELKAVLHLIPPCDVFEALEALVKRSLVERSTAQGFTLQPLIAEYLKRNRDNQ